MKTTILKKTLADLKREAKSGTLNLELVEWFGKTGEDIPERLRGIRQVKGRSNSIILINAKGEKSYLEFSYSNLIDYTPETLTLYNFGIRELTEEEQAEYQRGREEQERYDKANPYSESYWYMKDWWNNCKFPYLSGDSDFIHGKRLTWQDGKPMIYDKTIRGRKNLVYKVHYAINLNM